VVRSEPAQELLLLTHAFETIKARVVGFRTDNFNFRSQQAILALGAKFDGSIRRFQARKDGSTRDTLFYSILVEEWPDVKRHLELALTRRTNASISSTVL
jgi:N-acetyltransferase